MDINLFPETIQSEYKSDIVLTSNQQKHLVDQVIDQLDKFYAGTDDRKMVLNAFTGSGKTTVTLKSLIPEFIEKFYPQGKRVIVFMTSLVEVVDQSYNKALESLHDKTVSGKKIQVYNSDDIHKIKMDVKKGKATKGLSGDVVLLFISAQYFYSNYDLFSNSSMFHWVIVDEAHRMFGTISKEDTKADKNQHNEKFVAETLTKLRSLPNTPVLFLTATPTNSQQEKTPLGKANNIYLDPMPRDKMTTPFFDVVPYLDYEDTVLKSLDYFIDQCEQIGKVLDEVEQDTWALTKNKLTPTYPVLMARLSRKDARNGASLKDYEKKIRKICKDNKLTLMISTSENKEFDGKPISSMVEGVNLAMSAKYNKKPIVILVIESGTAGLDIPKINNVIISRDPKGVLNSPAQTAGRAARMKLGFMNHIEAVNFIKSLNTTDEQKRLLAEFYILSNTCVLHVPVDSKLLNNEVKTYIETDTFRESEGRKYILDNVFGDTHPELPESLRLVNSTSLRDDTYKQYKKDYCECCNVADDGHTHCFHSTWKGFENLIGAKITLGEMKILWPMCLHVHHMDGNHFNHAPENLKTICPNVHALVTMHNQDYNNRYDDLRASLKKIAVKRGVRAPKTLAFA